MIEIYFSQFWMPEVWGQDAKHDWFLMRAFFWVADGLFLIVSFYGGKREAISLASTSKNVLISFMRFPSSCCNYLPKATFPNNITLGIKFLHRNWRGGVINIQSTAFTLTQVNKQADRKKNKWNVILHLPDLK